MLILTLAVAPDVGAVRAEPVERDAPQQRADDEHAAVRGEHPAELVAGLQRGHRAVDRERQRPERDEQRAAVLLEADPHEVGAADLGHGRQQLGDRAPPPVHRGRVHPGAGGDHRDRQVLGEHALGHQVLHRAVHRRPHPRRSTARPGPGRVRGVPSLRHARDST